jgi:DNA processing protein
MSRLPDEERLARLRILEQGEGVPARLRRAVRLHGSALAALRQGTQDLFPRGTIRPTGGTAPAAVAPGEPDWPPGLERAPDPPALVFVRGGWPVGRRCLAIVGCRDADEYGLRVTARLAAAAAEAGWVVVSGGARGVDGAAHEGALAAGGRTVVVLGGGHDRPYPAEHRGLFERAERAGAVLSEYPPWRGPRPAQFLERNRLVAALADAVLVTQAGARSGALATSRLARELGRPVLAVPGDVCYGLASGVGGLLATGAAPVVGPAHLVALLAALTRGEPWSAAGWPPDPAPRARRGPLPGGVWPLAGGAAGGAAGTGGAAVARDDAWLMALLDGGAVVLVDDIVARSGRATAEVLRAVVAAELDGLVERVPGGRVRATGGVAPLVPRRAGLVGGGEQRARRGG